jgi:hypothetical protein
MGRMQWGCKTRSTGNSCIPLLPETEYERSVIHAEKNKICFVADD